MELNVIIIEQLPGNIPAFDRKGLIHEKKCFLSATKTALGCPCIILDQFASFFYPYIVRFFVVFVFFDYFVICEMCLAITTSIMQSL